MKKFGPEAKAAREKANAAEALEEERRKTAAMEKRAKEAEARNKQLELKLAADKLREQKQQRAMVEREKRFIAEGQNANASGSRGFAESETTKSFGASSSRGPTSSDDAREDGYDRDHNWEPRGASLWDHVDAAARTKEKKKKGAVSLESDDEGWIGARRPSTSRASLDASARWAPQTPGFGPGSSIGPGAPPPSASMAAFPSLGGGDVGSPAGS